MPRTYFPPALTAAAVPHTQRHPGRLRAPSVRAPHNTRPIRSQFQNDLPSEPHTLGTNPHPRPVSSGTPSSGAQPSDSGACSATLPPTGRPIDTASTGSAASRPHTAQAKPGSSRAPAKKRTRLSKRKEVTRKRLHQLAKRYKDNHDRFVASQAADDSGGAEPDVPEGEFEIEQLLCTDADGSLLIKWAGCDQPSWEPGSAIPASCRNAYESEGSVELREYLALLAVAC